MSTALEQALAVAARQISCGASTNLALYVAGLRKRWTGPNDKTAEVTLDGELVFRGGAWDLTCWLAGAES